MGASGVIVDRPMLRFRVMPVKPHLSAGNPGCYNHAMQADPRVGTELAGHRIEAVIGRGAMATVYRARHLGLGRTVALKVLDPALAEDAAFRERFIRECRTAAALDHPNVVTVYDAGEADGVLYLSMRYVEGTDLERLLEAEGYLSPEVAISIVAQCAAALDAAHAEGLVHRGVVPAAILLERGWMGGGRVFLARLRHREARGGEHPDDAHGLVRGHRRLRRSRGDPGRKRCRRTRRRLLAGLHPPPMPDGRGAVPPRLRARDDLCASRGSATDPEQHPA